MATDCAQTEILERSDTIEELTQYFEETAQELEQYEEWYESYEQQVAFTEANSFGSFNRQKLRLRNLFSHKLLLLLRSAVDRLSPLSTYLPPLLLFRRMQSRLLTCFALPSERSARVDGLADTEAPVRPAHAFAESLAFLRS